ncbi:MAG TPA: bifunctional demethylmenaquinone methyltransferase/2-methoxy-6-polyprenyl-1,4-benzoquinol methylase UbiE [Candidatus Acidoferrales bacterium]|nr:bifunctional demethylmenaquinone methyltransferase/2-methoxy-6-polyprenyl-1,4-benzoquinol methylase UbiE [Candidatus Acidoferrales bacterium]
MMRVKERAEPAVSGVLSGTRPEGARDEREAERQVREMFSRIAPRYDFLNHFLSLSFDRLWRRRTAQRFLRLMRRPDARILDVCCGTGDLAFALDRAREKALCYAAGTRASIVGCDFAEPMLGRAREKASRGGRRVEFAAGDGLRLPVRDASFDLVTTAFGFRNLANYEGGLREFARVLRPGGELGILEFTEPKNGALAAFYRFYFSRILPRVGGAISGSGDAYSYLPESVRKFPGPEALKEMMQGAGFREVNFERWTGGIVALHRGVRE